MSFENPIKLKCFEGLLIGFLNFDSISMKTKLILFISIFYNTASKKIANGQFWVSGASFGCLWDNRWCNEEAEPRLADFEQFPWKAGEPSNATNKECVAVDFSMNKAPHLTFFKANCDLKLKALFESKMRFNNQI
jgi:hypothetical protein